LIFSTFAAVLFLLKLSSPSRHCASFASELAALASGGDKGRTPQLQKEMNGLAPDNVRNPATT
jgi:hypothetical protein